MQFSSWRIEDSATPTIISSVKSFFCRHCGHPETKIHVQLYVYVIDQSETCIIIGSTAACSSNEIPENRPFFLGSTKATSTYFMIIVVEILVVCKKSASNVDVSTIRTFLMQCNTLQIEPRGRWHRNRGFLTLSDKIPMHVLHVVYVNQCNKAISNKTLVPTIIITNHGNHGHSETDAKLFIHFLIVTCNFITSSTTEFSIRSEFSNKIKYFLYAYACKLTFGVLFLFDAN